jgi:4-amino-4-deoxy-L-arabinose transferase-like glycosyltransferase
MTTARPSEATHLFWIAAALLDIAAAAAYHLAPSLPFGVAFDEKLKVEFVIKGEENFQHPLLMLQIVRAAVLATGAVGKQAVFELGRLAAALSGGLFVFAACALARRAMGDVAALGAGLLTAAAPLTVLHAQLFKEDIFLAPWLILGLYALDRLVETPTWRRAVLFGLAAGLAVSSKYVGLVLLALSLLPPLWVDADLRRYYRMVALAAVVAGVVFCIIDYPLFMNPLIFASGVKSEIDHSLSGHLIVLYGWQSNFLFTWTANRWPGLRAPLALAGLAGALLVAVQWRTSPPGFIVLNELFADQYLKALSLPGQQRIMRERAKAYEALMERPALRVTSTAGSFAFRNVPHRIVALAGDPTALAAAAERFANEPDITPQAQAGLNATPARRA